MKLFKDSRGFIMSFGWDMMARKEWPGISWCDPTTQDWQMSPNSQAGTVALGYRVAPEFVMESNGEIIAYQPGKCIVMQYIGGAMIWNIRTLQAESCSALAA